jgi:methylenetetrahydrofolate reductase (NADPH)
MERASDQKAEGRKICVELLKQLQQIKGVAGAHVMAPLNEAALAPTLAEFRGR